MKLQFDQIRTDGGTQIRAAINDDVVREYADSIKNGAQFPPLAVFYDGQDYWLADGFHRYRAYIQCDIHDIEVDVHNGTRRDAILYSVGANAEHGFPRTNADKRRAVMTLLKDEEWKTWSDHKIASKCHVDHKTVLKFRESSLGKFPSDASTSGKDTCRKFISKHGTPAVMNIKKIGKKKKAVAGPTRNSKLKPAVAKLGHSSPEPMVQVNLPPKNPKAAAAGIAALFTKEFIKQLIVELNVYAEEQ